MVEHKFNSTIGFGCSLLSQACEYKTQAAKALAVVYMFLVFQFWCAMQLYRLFCKFISALMRYRKLSSNICDQHVTNIEPRTAYQP